ncbi:CidA/LrgA family protein [Azovibrio restrictus]|uniref:CidA/LrgA family protein n=1 Tax=Azovibrio restrictus TaxID=146938 RepID=UPI0026EC38B1|nr:CidA/LrgA family protein [Azovibrio restrictus]MDD3484004.1 CidA/LrgA family protein [Azovibrio restrictus]
MLAAFTQILLFQLAGEVIARGLGLPVPGPVLGLLLLFGFLLWRGGPGPELQQAAQNLLQHLSLLFIPAGTGILLHIATLEREWLPISVAMVVSTVLAMAVTALLIQFLSPRQRDGHPETAAGERP